jgi:histidine phosphotransfer protein HptB
MNEPTLDPDVFGELQASAGADFVIELLDTFFEEAPLMLAELRQAQAAGDAERYRRAAHSLKSNSLTFGALLLGRLAREQEQDGLPATPAALDAIDAEYRRAAAALEERRDG